MPLKHCVIGCGFIARLGHGPALAKYRDQRGGIELAGCCDLSAERAAAFARDFGFARRYSDWEAMLEAERPDAVSLLVPESRIGPMSLPLLRRGVPLLIEKPPGTSIAENAAMIAAADAGGAPHLVAMNRRHMPLTHELHRLLREEMPPGALQNLHYRFSRVGRTETHFETTAIHALDYARNLIGSDFAQLSILYQPLPQFGPRVVNMLIQGTFKSGVAAQFHFSPVAGLDCERLTLNATDHTVLLRLPNLWTPVDAGGCLEHWQRSVLGRALSGPELAGSSELSDVMGFYRENEAFLDHLRAGTRPADDLRSCRQLVEIQDCLRQRLPEYRAD